MKKHVYRLSLLCLLLGTGHFANAQEPQQKVGINTDDPKETLDVDGTVRVRELPTSGSTPNVLYNGQANKSTPFTGTKTVVADAEGNLGTINAILPTGSDNNNTLKWKGNKWTAVPTNEIGAIYMSSESIKLSTTNNSFERAALTGDVTAQKDRNETKVVKIQGKDVADIQPQNDQVLKWNATENTWKPSADVSKVYYGSTSIILDNRDIFKRAALTGDVTASEGNNATTVKKIQGKDVADIQPTADQVLTWEGNANGIWKPKTFSNGAWLRKNTTNVATKTDNINSNSIYYKGKIGIGDFSNRTQINIDNGSDDREAQLSIIGGGKNQLRLFNEVTTGRREQQYKTAFDISTESGGLTFINRSEDTEWRTAYFLRNGSVIFAGHINNPGNFTGTANSTYRIESGKGFYYDSLNGRIAVATGTGSLSKPTQTIDAGGTARLRGISGFPATDSDFPVYVDNTGVLKRGTRVAGGSSPWRTNPTTPATSSDYNQTIHHEGAVGIAGEFINNAATLKRAVNNNNLEAVKLSVKGGVLAGSFQGVNGGKIFPDYVFQKYYTGVSSHANYQFRSLNQVEKFVKEKGHLPGYLSAKTIEEQGYIDLMKTQITNVEKIEELYLHTIEQEKAIKEKDAKIKELESRLERLEKLLIK